MSWGGLRSAGREKETQRTRRRRGSLGWMMRHRFRAWYWKGDDGVFRWFLLLLLRRERRFSEWNWRKW